MSGNQVGIVLFGANGKMGREISDMIQSQDGTTLVKGLGRADVSGGSLGQIAGAEVVIDFSAPELFRKALEWSVNQGLPFVSGTTGIEKADFAALEKAAQAIPVLWAPNMSLGVALLTQALQVFQFNPGYFDFHIEEFHHRQKRDNPGGTALALHKALNEVTGLNTPQPTGIRGGGIFGVHRVFAMAQEEVITFEHTALNRKVFARGAVVAAEWMKRRNPGTYAMADVLGLK